ncbi:MAG: MBL fold metallo-hydrolase [Pseudomonadota bacterium]
MRITLLCENEAAGMYWRAEWGFSALIEYRGAQILFDTGFSDVWRHNAAHAGLDLDQIDVVAFSHIHRDHTRGVLSHGFSTRKRAVLHPRVMAPAPQIAGDDNAAGDYRQIQATLARDFDVIEASAPLELAAGAWFLGEIPRVIPFERGAFFDDPMPDDTALAFATDKGAVVVSGCAHAGICNTCEAAKTVTEQKLHAVIGGFHLLHDEDPPVDATIGYFRREAPALLLPMHCIEFDILARFHHELGTRKLGAGDVIEI